MSNTTTEWTDRKIKHAEKAARERTVRALKNVARRTIDEDEITALFDRSDDGELKTIDVRVPWSAIDVMGPSADQLANIKAACDLYPGRDVRVLRVRYMRHAEAVEITYTSVGGFTEAV